MAPQFAAMDGGVAIVMIIFAIFGLPKLMAFVPDFDPLTVIVGIFVVLAAVQHLGFSVGGIAAEGESSSQSRRRSAGAGASGTEEDSKAAAAKPEELLKNAERCMQQNNYARVQELARRAADLDPENSRAWELLATAQKWEGKREEAAATVRRAREVFEVDSAGLRKLAKELEQAESPSAMAAECEAKGEDFFAKRQYDLAVDCYTKALEALGELGAESPHKGSQLGLLRRRAECAQQLQDWGTCRRDATAVLEAEPSDVRALLQRAAANEALEKFAAALEDARKLLAIDPKSAVANRIVHNCQQALRG